MKIEIKVRWIDVGREEKNRKQEKCIEFGEVFVTNVKVANKCC